MIIRQIPENSKEHLDSYQTSPGYALTFTRLSNRDTFNYEGDKLETRKPLVVVNDAVSINVQYSKSNPIPTMSCVLKQGDINYLTAVHPGDYVIVNMVNWESKAMEIRERALGEKILPINRKGDGFKGLFKILDVNMSLSVDQNGDKQYFVQITARGFDEFNNVLYFNPAMVEDATKSGQGLLQINNFGDIKDYVLRPSTNNVQTLIKQIIKRTIGVGLHIKDVGGNPNSPNASEHLNQIPKYLIPGQIKDLLGLQSAQTISDINKYYLGIYDSFGYTKSTGSFFETKNELQGARKVFIGDFQTITTWSLLQEYSNHHLNESYTCYKEAPNGSVYPSVVVRQKPFTTRHYENFCQIKKIPVSENTVFLDLPRWKISPNLIFSLNLGRSDHGRFNFVQVFTRQIVNPTFDSAKQMVEGNFVEDQDDVIRHGRKPFIVTCPYDPPAENGETFSNARKWAYLIADWVFNGHLKMNGSMQTVGIEEPICVGDNLEFDNVVYHIESISHVMNINQSGVKIFRTNLTLSSGVSDSSSSTIPVYGEMDHTDAFSKRKEDYNREGVLPGFSDTQDIPVRVNGEEVKNTPEKTFTNPGRNNKGDKK